MKTQISTPNLGELFARTAPEFQAKIRDISTAGGLPELDVYRLWREYAKSCEVSDQSALVWEFRQWYGDKLGLTEEVAQ